jgi:phage-related protein
LPILNDVIDDIGPLLADALEESTPAILDMIEAIVPLLPKLIDLGISALPGIIQAIEIIVPLLVDWTETTTGIFEIVSGFFEFLNGDITMYEFGQRLENAGGAAFDFLAGVREVTGGAVRAFMGFQRSVGEAITGAIGFVIGLPGRAASALSNIGRSIYGAGRDLIQGFIDGIESMMSGIGDAVGGVLDFAKGFFPSSPAKRGPFSGSGWTDIKASGGALLDQFTSGANGTIDITPRIGDPRGAVRAARRAASTVAGGAGGAVGGGGTVIKLTQNITSSDPLLASRQAARELTRYMGVA